MERIVLGGGCFWGVEAYFKRVKGVLGTKVGYANGDTPEVNYQEVCTGETGYVEACYLEYDEKIITLEKILEHLFKVIDPTSLNKQGNDKGTQYRSGIYYLDEDKKEISENFIEEMKKNYKDDIVVEVLPLENFYGAEEYHQEYLEKNPNGYCHINFNILESHEKQEPAKTIEI